MVQLRVCVCVCVCVSVCAYVYARLRSRALPFQSLNWATEFHETCCQYYTIVEHPRPYL